MYKKSNCLPSLLLIVVMFFASCKKENKKEIEIDSSSLTECSNGAECQYLFTEDADVVLPANGLKTGSYRLFWHNQETPGISSYLYVKAPMTGNSFELKKTDILDGKVVMLSSCPTCYMIPFKAVDGYVKGINVTPGKRADRTKWLLEIKIFREAESDASIKDTISIKQYFYPNFIID